MFERDTLYEKLVRSRRNQRDSAKVLLEPDRRLFVRLVSTRSLRTLSRNRDRFRNCGTSRGATIRFSIRKQLVEAVEYKAIAR